MSVIYEVNLEVHPDIAREFADWLPGHVEAVLELPGFVDAEIATEEDGSGTHPAWSVRYRLIDRESLDQYIVEHAERMRAEGSERFGDKFSASRRILKEQQRFPHK